MPEPTQNQAPAAGQDPAANAAAGANGNEPGQNGNAAAANTGIPDFDPTKLSNEQINKVLEDQRIWNTQRLKELREQAKKGKDYETEQAKKAQEEAVKKGEFDKVLGEKDAKIQELTAQLQNVQVDNALRGELQKAGVKNIEAGLKLLDRTNVKIGENGKLEGLDSALQAFKAAYPELLNSSSANVGSGTNPGDPNANVGQFKMSQIRDPEFYAKNHVAIKQAMAKGQIINDIS